jgi:hypothetical protein
LDSGFWIAPFWHRARLAREGRMDVVRAAFIAAGAAISPLRCLNDVAALFAAAASVAVGTPQRALRVARLVGGALVEQVPLLDQLLRSLATMPVACELLAMLPARDNMTFVTECSACVVCGGGLTTTDQSITLPLFSAHGVKTVHLFHKKCDCCGATHHHSYAVGGTCLASGEQKPYKGCTDSRFFHITTSAMWERCVLIECERCDRCAHACVALIAA